VLARKGFYRHVWHPALFDSSLFIIVLGVFFTIFSKGGI
jgi:protein-S-isoprenylcysteine O-methyltransferase Ste14